MADYKVVQYVNDKDEDVSQSSSKRSCYSFCMCPGGQVQFPYYSVLLFFFSKEIMNKTVSMYFAGCSHQHKPKRTLHQWHVILSPFIQVGQCCTSRHSLSKRL